MKTDNVMPLVEKQCCGKFPLWVLGLCFAILTLAVAVVICCVKDSIPGVSRDKLQKNFGAGSDVSMGNFRRFDLLGTMLSTNALNCLKGELAENRESRPIELNTWMGAYNCYSDTDLQGVLMAQLACFMLNPRLAVAMWYREDRRISRVLCLAYIAYLYPVDPMSGDIYPEMRARDDEELKCRLRSYISSYRRPAARYEETERQARLEEIEYVEQHVMELTGQIKALSKCCGSSMRKRVSTHAAMFDHGTN